MGQWPQSGNYKTQKSELTKAKQKQWTALSQAMDLKKCSGHPAVILALSTLQTIYLYRGVERSVQWCKVMAT